MQTSRDLKAEHQDCSCPVCLENYRVAGKNAMKVIVDCQHSVCAACLPQQNHCPICRNPVTKTIDAPYQLRELIAGNSAKVADLLKEINQLKQALVNKDLDPRLQPIRNAKIKLANENLIIIMQKRSSNY